MELLVQTTDTGQVISARVLHEFLEVGRVFSTWMKERITKYQFKENEDYQEVWNDTESGVVAEFSGNTHSMVKRGHKKDYLLSMDMAKELSMIENNEKGRLARKYFIACEKSYMSMIKSQLDLVSMNTNLLNTKDWDLLKGSAKSITYLEEKIKSDVKDIERILGRINDHRYHLNIYGTAILDIAKNIEQGKLRKR